MTSAGTHAAARGCGRCAYRAALERRRTSIRLRDHPPRVVRLDVALGLLPLGELYLLARDVFVGDQREHVANAVQAGAALVVGSHDVPRRRVGVRGEEHLVAGAGVVVPAVVGFQVHVAELPDLPRVLDAVLEPPGLLFLANFEPILDEQDARVGDGAFDARAEVEEALHLLRFAKAHDGLDAGTIVPGAVEEDDLPRRGKQFDVALQVHLALLALRRRRERGDAEHAGAGALGNRLDDAAFAGGVAAL